MGDSIQLTDPVIRVVEDQTQPLWQAIDVSQYQELDLELGVIAVEDSETSATIEILTGMDPMSDDEWQIAGAFDTAAAENTWQRRTFDNLLRYVRWQAADVTGAVTFSIRGMGRRERAPFAPTALQGLVAWYTADSGVSFDGNLVSAWKDQSGNGFHLVQATGSKQPVLESAGLNRKPCLHFDGVDDTLTCASFPDAGNGSTVFMLLAEQTAPTYGWYLGRATGTSGKLILQNYNSTYAQRALIGSAALVDGAALVTAGKPFVVEARHLPAGTRGEVWLNGGLKASSDAVSFTSASTSTLEVGGVVGSDAYPDVRIRQLLWFNRPLTDLEQAQVTAFLMRDGGLR